MDNSNKSVSVQTKNAVPQKKALHFLKLASFWVLSIVSVYMLSGGNLMAFADDVANDASFFDTVVDFIVTWVQRIGGVIGFIGAIQFGMAFKNDDADGKTRGLMTLASGFIVIAICIAYNTLFKQS